MVHAATELRQHNFSEDRMVFQIHVQNTITFEKILYEYKYNIVIYSVSQLSKVDCCQKHWLVRWNIS